MMNVYVVMVTPEASHSKVNQEGYLSLAATKEFIESRKPETKSLDLYHYRNEDYTKYEIIPIKL